MKIMQNNSWQEQFDNRFPKALLPLIDRELQQKGLAEEFFGKDSEYFGAIKSFIQTQIIEKIIEEAVPTGEIHADALTTADFKKQLKQRWLGGKE